MAFLGAFLSGVYKMKYGVGDLVVVVIGSRPPMELRVLGCVDRSGPHYMLDWTVCGFDSVLNTVAIPEGSLEAVDHA